MNLSRYGRLFYKVSVVTDPAVDGWEASFDGGTTWTPGTPIPAMDGGWQWLVQGPDVDPASASALTLTGSVAPLLRVVDTPEVVVEDAPRIWLD